MRSILIGDPDSIKSVYSAKTLEALTAEAALDENILTYDMLKAGTVNTEDVDFLFSTWGMPALTHDEIEKHFPALRALFYAAGSVKAFASPFLDKGVKISSAYAANAIPVAEYTVGQILLAAKGFFRASALYSKGHIDEARRIGFSYPGNFSIRVGLIGIGMVGKAVCRLLKANSLEILVNDPYLSDEEALELGVKKASLEEIFSTCQVVSNHVPNIPSTRGMFNYGLFSMMKENSTFINTGRGAQVVEDDLCRILSERDDIVALLDVTDPEPPLPDSPLFKLDNAILTPHIAGSLGNETLRMGEYALSEFRRFVSGEGLEYEITAEMLPRLA